MNDMENNSNTNKSEKDIDIKEIELAHANDSMIKSEKDNKVENDNEITKNNKIKEKNLNIFSIMKYSDWKDRILQIFGLLGAFIAGLGVTVGVLFLGFMMDNMETPDVGDKEEV